jgi:hypothetical protein
MWRLPFAVSLALAAACGHSPDPRLAPLAQATLEAGGGLGDLRLGQTTLGRFFDRFGAGLTMFVASDEIAFELAFEGGEIAFLFQFDSARLSDEEVMAVRRATRNMGEYLAAYPQRRELPLSSITVRIDEDKESTFYKGKLAQGVALFDPFLISAGRVGMIEEGSLPLLAGLSPNTPTEQARFPEQGLVLYGEREPKPGTPSRVTRMTVFLPESPSAEPEEAGD